MDKTRSEEIREKFEKEFPPNEIRESPIKCATALGYLMAVTDLEPSTIVWASFDMIALTYHMEREFRKE